jgi:DNA-binding response OmpR family regulator
MRILIIEDDKAIRDILSLHFKAASFAVDTTDCGERGSYLGRTNDYDLIILDYNLPKKDGYTICRDLRTNNKTMPIIMLTVKSNVTDKVVMLNAGIDDYLTKPFSLEELQARVNALLRRPREIQPQIITISNITIDSNQQSVAVGKQRVYLTRKEFALLEYLARNKNIVMTRSMILEHVWDGDSDPFSNTIESHILNLRKKLGERSRKIILTVPGRGYKLEHA